MSVFSSPTMLVSFAVIVVGCILIWLIARSGKSRPQNEIFPPQSGTSAFSGSDSTGQAIFSDSLTQSEGYSSQGSPDSDRPFSMTIEDVFSITGRGPIVTGRVERGSLRVGDDVEIVGPHRTCRATVVGIEKFRKTVSSISTGEIGGLLLRGVTSDDVERGHVVVLSGKSNKGFTDSVEQGVFDVILQSPGDMQVRLIKEIRVITKLGLLEAKQLVDTAPNCVLHGVSKETALRAKEKLEAAGASVIIK